MLVEEARTNAIVVMLVLAFDSTTLENLNSI